jgi:hypothetical protein
METENPGPAYRCAPVGGAESYVDAPRARRRCWRDKAEVALAVQGAALARRRAASSPASGLMPENVTRQWRRKQASATSSSPSNSAAWACNPIAMTREISRMRQPRSSSVRIDAHVISDAPLSAEDDNSRGPPSPPGGGLSLSGGFSLL